MAAALSLGAALPVCAEEHQGLKNWQVVFDGNQMDSNFSSSELAEEIYGMQPGDCMEVQVALKNSSDITTGWYMENEILSALEDSQETAGGGAYAYRLAYVGPDGGEDVLYDSKTVGGEGSKGDTGEGLAQVTDSLKDFFYLDTLESGQDGLVKLTVGLDGESQGNAYQDTLAKLQMNFAAEVAENQIVTAERMPLKNTGARVPDQGSSDFIAAVQTSDPTRILPYCLAALVAGIVFLMLGSAAIRKRHSSAVGKGGEE